MLVLTTFLSPSETVRFLDNFVKYFMSLKLYDSIYLFNYNFTFLLLLKWHLTFVQVKHRKFSLKSKPTYLQFYLLPF